MTNTWEWQPIKTAPKDNVIILTECGCLWQGFWADGYGWITGYDDGKVLIRIKVNPTHWTPLPSGPVKEETDNAPPKTVSAN